MTRPLQPGDVIGRRPCQIASLADGRLLLRGPDGLRLLGGVPRETLEWVLEQLDGRRTVSEICKALADDFAEQDVFRLLRNLQGLALEVVKAPEAEATVPPDTVPPNTVPPDTVPPDTVPTQAPQATKPLSALVLGDGLAAKRLAELLDCPTQPDLPEEASCDIDLVICALEEAPYDVLFDIQHVCWRNGTACLFVTFDPDGTRIGPTVIPKASPCFACAQVASFRIAGLQPATLHNALRGFATQRTDAETFEPAAREVIREARSILAAHSPAASLRAPELSSSVLLLTHDRRRITYAVQTAPDCPLCLARQDDSPREHPLADSVRHDLLATARRSPRQASVADRDDLRTKVGILGGGTAGYLTAIALRRRLPQLDVTLIESSTVPVIGVGEATTPLMPQFLHVDLGLDIHEFFREVEPTLKLGIHFDWGPSETGFNYPFGPVHVLEPLLYDADLLQCSPQSTLMAAGKVPIYRSRTSRPENPWRSELDVDTAYHLDNQRFVAYLRRKARELGVTTVDAKINDVQLAEDGETVTGLRDDQGRRFTFDLFVDCTGFRSLLLGAGLGSPFRAYDKSLFADRALVATVPQKGDIAPYTRATTANAGWWWSTPQREEDHRGYVFCSAFASPEEAEREMRNLCPGLSEPRLLSFRTGRHQHFMKGNVVALGNAYGFVEPLESTALHMLIRQIGMLLSICPLRRGKHGRGEHGVATLLNRRVGAYWDYLSWFLALHYRFNRRLDTPFWRHCRAEVDVSAHAELIEAYRERGPLSYQPAIRDGFRVPDPLWGAEGIDVILAGQQVSARLPQAAASRAEWSQRTKLYRAVTSQAVPQAQALRALGDEPELLERWVAALEGFGPAFSIKP